MFLCKELTIKLFYKVRRIQFISPSRPQIVIQVGFLMCDHFFA